MNKLLLFGLAMAAAGSVSAQSLSLLPQEKKIRAPWVQNILNRQQQNGLMRPTTIQQRVIGLAQSMDGQTDSIAYTYTGVHKSVYNHNAVNLGYATNFDPNYAPMPGLLGSTYSDDMEADSINQFSAGEFVYAEVATYNPQDRIDSVVTLNVPLPESKMNTVYNNEGLLEEVIYSDIWGSEPVPTEKWKIIYSEDNERQIADSFYSFDGIDWFPYEYSIYEYDGEGNLTSASIYDVANPDMPYLSVALIYNDDGLLAINNVYMGDMDPENLYLVDSITYSAGSSLFLEFTEYLFQGSSVFATKIARTFGDNGLPDTVNYSMFDMASGWNPMQTSIMNYNDFGNPEHFTFYLPETESPAAELHFYYEEYDDETGIEAVAAAKQLTVYPNPLRDELHFDLPEGGQQVKATVYNILGQQVYERQTKATSGKYSLNLSELSPGNYLLQVVDEKGNTYRGKVVKQ